MWMRRSKKSSQIKSSRLGLGFEKLDRKAFDPEKAYDKVADLGSSGSEFNLAGSEQRMKRRISL